MIDQPLVENRRVMLAGVAGGALLLYLAVRHLSWVDVADALGDARLLPWLPIAVLSYLSGHWFRGARTRLLVSPEARITLVTATNVVVLGYAVNNLLPSRLGEVARAGTLAQRTGLPIGQTLTVTLVERILDGWALLLLLGLAALNAPIGGWVGEVAAAAAFAFLLASVAIALVLVTPTFVVGLVSRATSRLSAAWHEDALAFAIAVTRGLAALRRPVIAGRLVALSLGVWLLEAGLFLFLLPAFGLGLRPWLALVTMAVTNLGILVPSSPGFIGPFHYLCMRAVADTGVASATALSYAIVVHLAFYVPVTIWGVGVIFWYGVELGTTLALSRSTRRHPGGRVRPLRTNLYHAITEAVVPADLPSLSAEERERVVFDTSEFVAGQIAALPFRLLVLFRIGMTGFRVLNRVRYLRGYCDLPLPTRVAVVKAWAWGPVGPARQLFRALRSIALLAYFEHPLVAARMTASASLPVAGVSAAS